jgi:hypothetical protein
MGLLNVGILSTNVGDGSGNNRNNSNFFVKQDGGHGGRERKSERGDREQGRSRGKSHRRHHCDD